MQTRVRRERARRPRPAQGFVTKTGAGMRLSRIGRPRMCVSRTRTSRTRVSAMRTSQTSPTRARRARAMGSRADQGRERDEHTPRPPMPHTRLPHTSRHRRIGGDRRSSPRPRSPIGTTPACRARGNRTGSGRPRSGAVSGRGPGAFVALCRASESASASASAFAFAFDIWPFDPRPDPLLHRPASSTARAKYTRETIRAARAAGNPCVRRRETAAPGWTPPAGREAPGGKARGRGHIAAGTSARHAARRARHASRPGHAVLAPARAQRHTRTHAHTRTRTCARAPHAIRRGAPRRAQSTARSRLRASLGGAHRVAPRTVTSRRCLAARRPIRHTVILSCARNARGRPGRYRLHRPLVNPASRRARRDHASNAAITSHI
ncbi:priA domain protein [Burkholderia pseudomallei]|nr:priA domain protein [Burkholderia pseudomallei]CAJ8415592.1 priA domain protein [Burkholderia pseudomallei]